MTAALKRMIGDTAENTGAQTRTGSEKAVVQASRILRPHARAVWVVGLCRDNGGGLLHIPADITVLHKQVGYMHDEEVIVYHDPRITGAIQRVGNFERGNKRLIRCHEYMNVYTCKKEGDNAQ